MVQECQVKVKTTTMLKPPEAEFITDSQLAVMDSDTIEEAQMKILMSHPNGYSEENLPSLKPSYVRCQILPNKQFSSYSPSTELSTVDRNVCSSSILLVQKFRPDPVHGVIYLKVKQTDKSDMFQLRRMSGDFAGATTKDFLSDMRKVLDIDDQVQLKVTFPSWEKPDNVKYMELTDDMLRNEQLTDEGWLQVDITGDVVIKSEQSNTQDVEIANHVVKIRDFSLDMTGTVFKIHVQDQVRSKKMRGDSDVQDIVVDDIPRYTLLVYGKPLGDLQKLSELTNDGKGINLFKPVLASSSPSPASDVQQEAAAFGI